MKLLLNKEEVAKILVGHFEETTPGYAISAKITPHGEAIAVVDIVPAANKTVPYTALQEAVNIAMQHASDPLNPSTYEAEL